MRKYVFAAVLSVMILAAGCSSESSNTSIEPVNEETTTAVVTTAAEVSGEGQIDQEALDATLESLEARAKELDALAESLGSVEESLIEMEASVQEVMSSIAEETTEEETEEETTAAVAYKDLVESASEYMDQEVTYTGSVVQAAAVDSDTLQILIAVDDDDSERLVGEFDKSLLSDALSHGDTVTVKGTFDGVNRYLMGNGERVELPSLKISEISVVSVAATEPETEAEAAAAETETSETVTETVPETAPETTAGETKPRGPLDPLG